MSHSSVEAVVLISQSPKTTKEERPTAFLKKVFEAVVIFPVELSSGRISGE